MSTAGIVKSAARVLEIFEFFRAKKGPLSVRQIAEHFDYPMSSTAALIKSLESAGYLSYERGIRAYLPTIRLAQLGEWVYEGLAHRDGLIELLAELADRTGGTAILNAQNDIYADHIYVVPGHYHIQLVVPPGTRRLLCRSAHGWAILAGYPDPVIRDLVSRTRTALGRAGQTITYDWVMVHVRDTRAQGYALTRSLLLKDAAMVAMALPPGTDGSRLAVGVGGNVRRIDRDLEKIVSVMGESLRRWKANHGKRPK